MGAAVVAERSAPALGVAPAGPADLEIFPPGAARVVLAGQPSAAAATQGAGGRGGAAAGAAVAVHPKELLLPAAAALAAARGLPAERANPHFTPVAGWAPEVCVLHLCALGLACPLPVAHNALLLDGEDLLLLAEERRAEAGSGLHRRRLRLMDAVLSAAPEGAGAGLDGLLPPGVRAAPAPLGGLLAAAAAGAPTAAAAIPPPVHWMECDLQTGPYNFLHLRREPVLGTSHVGVMLGAAAAAGGPLVAFATPATLGEVAPALRAFAAVAGPPQAGGGGAAARLLVFFFGTPAEFAAALAERPEATFFGDNFRCAGARILFAPFAPAEVVEAVRGAAACLDTCYGGVLDGLARAVGAGQRLVLGPGGRFDAWAPGGRRLAAGIAWDEAFAPEGLARRRHKADRRAERDLADALEAVLG